MAERQKVLYVEMAHGMGGSVISLYQLVRGLDKSLYEPIVLFYWENPYVQKFRDLGVEVIVWAGQRREGDATVPLALPLGSTRRSGGAEGAPAWWRTLYHALGFYLRFLLQTLPLAWRLVRLIRARRVELVHANDLVGCNREVILAAWWTRRPCLCHIRAFETYTALDRLLVHLVTRFIFISQSIAASCVAQGADPAKGVVIYNALQLAEYLQAFDDGRERERLGLGREAYLVGIMGRLVRWKGQEVFLRAMAQAGASVPGLHGLIIGDAEPSEQAYRQELEELARTLGLSERVHFLGWRSDVPQLLAALDVLVHASLEPEPFGRVLIEGMAAGKPVIAAAAGACPEIIEDGVSGLLVPPGDPELLAQAVTSLLQDPARMRAMGIVARRQVELRFSIEEHVRQVMSLYGQLRPPRPDAETEQAQAAAAP